jgi:hypothetical protein
MSVVTKPDLRPSTEQRLHAMANKVCAAQGTIEALEDELAETAAQVREAQRAERRAAARAKAAATRATKAKVAHSPLAAATKRPSVAVLRLALNKSDAAAALGVSVDFFDDHIVHELRVTFRGRRRLYAVRELERWLDESAGRVLGGSG